MVEIFHNILLLGRPASGKSEFIDFIKKVPESIRAEKYHIGKFAELDDFPWIWEKFMEDNIWEAAGYPRRYSFGGNNPGLFKEGAPLFDFCIQKFNHEYQKHQQHAGTLFVEFSRGGKDGYARALNQLSPEILKDSGILFLLVSYEESCRRNHARYLEKLKHSILAHKVPDETMETFYQTHDWLELTRNQESGYLKVASPTTCSIDKGDWPEGPKNRWWGSNKIPFVTINNEPELTDPVALDKRYGPALRKLMELKNANI